MNKTKLSNPWVITVLGLILIAVGAIGASNKSLIGNPILIIFDFADTAPLVLLIYGIVMFVKNKKQKTK